MTGPDQSPDIVTCAIHQPNLLPRPNTLSKIATADIWVVLDDVQFNRRDYQHRARLAALTDERHQQWLSLTVHRPTGRATTINDVLIVDPETNARRVTKLIEQYYRRAPHWHLVRPLANEIAAAIRTGHRLATVTELSTRLLLDRLGWQGITIRSSTLPTRTGRSTRLADLTKRVGASTYLCGPGGARYLDERPFAEHGITVRYTDVGQQMPWQRPLSAIRQLATAGHPLVNLTAPQPHGSNHPITGAPIHAFLNPTQNTTDRCPRTPTRHPQPHPAHPRP